MVCGIYDMYTSMYLEDTTMQSRNLESRIESESKIHQSSETGCVQGVPTQGDCNMLSDIREGSHLSKPLTSCEQATRFLIQFYGP